MTPAAVRSVFDEYRATMIHAELGNLLELEHPEIPGSMAHGGAVTDKQFQSREIRRCRDCSGTLAQMRGHPFTRLGE